MAIAVIAVRLALLLPLAGCATALGGADAIVPLSSTDPIQHDVQADERRPGQAIAAVGPEERSSPIRSPRDEFLPGSGRFWRSPAEQEEPRQSAELPSVRIHDNEVTLNLVNVSIAEAAKSILGNVLGANYVIDERLQARITLQTSNPVPAGALLEIFETALSANGAAVVALANGGYKILPAGSAGASQLPVRIRGEASTAMIGRSIQVVPLQFVAAADMQRILEPIAAQGAVLRIDEPRNLVFLSGTTAELRALLDTVDTFDVDWLDGMSFALVPIKASDPTAITKELETIFASGQSGPLQGLVRFVPNRRLKSVLVISQQRDYLARASEWIKRLDRAAEATERQLFVYNVQNRAAPELASLLRSVFLGQAQADDVEKVAPRYEPVQLASNKGDRTDVADGEGPSLEAPSEIETTEGLRIIGDDSNNSLLVVATHDEYRQITDMLETLDAIPNQVLLEATIAEVSLNDELKFGLRWFFESGKSNITLTDAVSGVVASSFPGFSYLFSSADVRLVLNAISSITDVDVISSPTIMVLDNREAVLQVGDQVPVVTQSAVSVADPGAPVVNTVAFRDTGVILTVTPRVSDSGRVMLDIEQEVSDVVETTTSGIDSPTIQQRRVRTTVVVNDGETLALGGLIQQSATRGHDKIPVLGDIPLVGTAFRSTSDRVRRTELIILITPRVVRDVHEARRVTDEFRQRLNEVGTEVRRHPSTPRETIGKVVN